MPIEPDWAARIVELERRNSALETSLVNVQSSLAELINKNNQLILDSTGLITAVNKNTADIGTLENLVATNKTNINSNTQTIAALRGASGGLANFNSVLTRLNGVTPSSGWQVIYTASVAAVVQLSVSRGPTTLDKKTVMLICGVREYKLSEFIEVGDAWYIQIIAPLRVKDKIQIYEVGQRYTGTVYRAV